MSVNDIPLYYGKEEYTKKKGEYMDIALSFISIVMMVLSFLFLISVGEAIPLPLQIIISILLLVGEFFILKKIHE